MEASNAALPKKKALASKDNKARVQTTTTTLFLPTPFKKSIVRKIRGAFIGKNWADAACVKGAEYTKRWCHARGRRSNAEQSTA